jgi:hypothetical protein
MPIILKDLKNNLLKVNFDDNVIIGKSIFNNKKIYINNINPNNNINPKIITLYYFI